MKTGAGVQYWCVSKLEKQSKQLQTLEKICKKLNPKFPFTYQFSDLEYARLYKSEQVVSKLSSLFAFLSYFHFLLRAIWLSYVYRRATQQRDWYYVKCWVLQQRIL